MEESNWIKTSDRAPKVGSFIVGSYGGKVWLRSFHADQVLPDYWMLIPELPKDEPAISKPEYRAFEIDWRRIPSTEGDDCGLVSVALFPVIDGYRVFGFGNSENFEYGQSYSAVPCDDKGNFKYAFGRLED